MSLSSSTIRAREAALDPEPTKSFSDLLKTWAPISVSVGGLLFAAVTFYILNIYLPDQQPRALNVVSTLEKVREDDSFVILKGTLKVKNITKTRVEVLGGFYNVLGWRLEPQAKGVTALADPQKLFAMPDRRFDLHFASSKKTAISTRILIDESDDEWWDPDQEYDQEFHVYVPRDRYDVVQLGAMLIYTKQRDGTSVRWSVDPQGAVSAAPCRKLPGYEQDRAKCQAPSSGDPQSAAFWNKYALSENDTVSELSLLPSAANKPLPIKH